MPVLDRSKTQATPRSPQPNPPVRQFSFTDFQVNNPSAPLPADRIDGEIDRTNNALSDTLDWVSVSLNSDGSLKPQSVGKAQLQPGLFDHIAAPALDEVQGLANSARAAAREAIAAGQEADASAFAAAAQNAQAFDAAQLSSSDAQDAASSAAEAAQSALEADISANQALNHANHTDLAEATCTDYGVLTQAWAEHMPDTIPPNILAVMDVTGDHWSSRWWANQAAILVAGGAQAVVTLADTPPTPPKTGQLWWDAIGGQLYVYYDDGSSKQWVAATSNPGPQGVAGPQGPTGAQGPPGTGSVAGMTAGQIPIAASATGISSSGLLNGDVVSTPTTLATTIQPNAVTTAKILNAAVTYAKIQNVAANRIIGNSTGSPAAPAEIALPLAVALGGTGNTAGPAALTALGAVAKAGDTMTGPLTVPSPLAVTGASNVRVTLGNTASGLTHWLTSANTASNGFDGFAVFDGTGYRVTVVGGNVGIDTTGPSEKLEVNGNIRLSGGLAVGGNATAQFAQTGFYTSIYANDTTAANRCIQIGNLSDPTNYYRNTTHSFADQTGSNIIMRLALTSQTFNGSVGIGTTAPQAKLHTVGQSAAGASVSIIGGGPAGADTTTVMSQFTDAGFTVQVGAIVRNGTNTVAYGTASDQRLKDGITPTKRGLDALMAIQVSDYRMGETQQQGLVAQQVAEHYPEAVVEGGDDPAMQPWMIDYGRLMPLTIRTVQQQQAQIERLEKRLEVLEGRKRH